MASDRTEKDQRSELSDGRVKRKGRLHFMAVAGEVVTMFGVVKNITPASRGEGEGNFGERRGITLMGRLTGKVEVGGVKNPLDFHPRLGGMGRGRNSSE